MRSQASTAFLDVVPSARDTRSCSNGMLGFDCGYLTSLPDFRGEEVAALAAIVARKRLTFASAHRRVIHLERAADDLSAGLSWYEQWGSVEVRAAD